MWVTLYKLIYIISYIVLKSLNSYFLYNNLLCDGDKLVMYIFSFQIFMLTYFFFKFIIYIYNYNDMQITKNNGFLLDNDH